MTVDGKKFSGNAQYRKRGRIMHHGTILFDSDLDVVGKALMVSRDKIASKGLKSVRSRVTNLRPLLREDLSVEAFMRVLREALFREFPMIPRMPGPQDNAAVARLRSEVYDTWDWNYGRSPACNIIRERRLEGVGTITARMDVECGVVRGISFSGDYFGNADAAALSRMLIGRRLTPEDLASALETVEIEEYFHNLEKDALIAILTGEGTP